MVCIMVVELAKAVLSDAVVEKGDEVIKSVFVAVVSSDEDAADAFVAKFLNPVEGGDSKGLLKVIEDDEMQGTCSC